MLTTRKDAGILTSMIRNTRTDARPCNSLNEWMERHQVNGTKLLRRLRDRGVSLSAGHLSNILKGSRRVSLRLAIELNDLTGVPIKALAQWPVREPRSTRSRAQVSPAVEAR